MKNPNEIEELAIIRTYKENGDLKPLGELYNEYMPLVYGVCLKYLKNQADAQDAVMSIYELIVRKLKTNDVKAFKPWLYVVTKNFCFDQLRKEKRQLEKEKASSDVYSELIFHPDNEGNEVIINKLNDCIDKLTEDQKLCIKEFYYNNKGYQVIADEQKISWNRVRSRIQNGRRMLKNCIDNS